eukprot:g440.t1
MSGKHRSIGGSSVRSSAAKKSGRSNSPQAGEMAKGRGASGAGAKPTPHCNHITAADLEQFAVSSLKKIISQRGFSASDLGRKHDIIAFIVGLKAFTREGDLPKFLQQYPTTNRLKRAREEQEVDGQKADSCAQDLVVAPGVKRRKDVADGKILFGGSAAQEVVPAIDLPNGAQTKSEGQPVAAGKRKAKPSPATQKEKCKSKRHPDPPSSQLPPKRVAASQQVSQKSVVFSQNQAHGTPARRPGKKNGEEGNFLSAQKQVAQTPLSVSKYKRRKLLNQLLNVPTSEHEGNRPAFNVEDYYFCTGCGGRMKKYVSSRCYGNVVYRFSCEHSFYESGNDKDKEFGAGLVPSFCAKMMKTSADYARSKGCANHSMEEMLAFLEPLLCPTLRLEMEAESSFRVYLVEEPPPEQTSTRKSSFRLLTGQRLLCELLRCGIAKDLLLDPRDAESFEVDDSEGNHHFAVEGQKKRLVFPLSEYERILELVEGELRDRVQHLLPLSWGAGCTTGLPTTTTTFISSSSSSSTSTMATSIGGGSLATCGAEHKVVNTKISTSGSGLPFQLQIEGIDPGVLKFFRSLGQTQVAAKETAERSSSAAEVESAIKRLRDLHMWDRVGIENASNEGCREEPLRGYQQAGVRWCLDQAQCASLALASDFASKWNVASSGTYVSTTATAGSLKPKPKAKRKTSGKTTKTSAAPPPPEGPKTEAREPLRLLLADEMGLGKTRQAIALLFAKKLFPSIIVVKAVTRLAWKMEIENFAKFGLESTKDVHLIQSADDAWHTNANLPMITVVSYHMAVNLMPQLMAKREKLLSCVVDEAHELRNASSGTSAGGTRATTYSTSMAGELLTFIRDIPHLLLLTGTPCANRVQDLRVLAGVLQGYGVSGASTTSAAFLQDYLVKFEKASATLKNRMQVLPVPTNKQLMLPVSTTRSHELNLLLRSTIMLRRMKKDVVSELPALVETPVHVPIGRQTWRKVENQFRRIVGEPEERDELPGAAGREDFGEENTAAGDEASDAKNGNIPSATADGKEKPQSFKRSLEEFEIGRAQRAALAKLYEMRHWLRDLVIANTAAAADGVLEDGGPGDNGDKNHCTKNRKIVLFAHHKRVFDMVVEWVLRSQNVGQQGQHHEDGESSFEKGAAVIPYVRIDGDLEARGKQQQLELFTSQKNAEGAASVALVSMTAAGIGINGLEAASCCVFLELPDSPHWWLQCRARVDRFGQTGERVWFYYLIEAASAGGKRKLGIDGRQDAETDAAAGVESAEEVGESGDESEGDEEDSDGGENGEDAGEKAGNADDGKDGNGQGRRVATERKNSSATTLDARRWAQLNRKVARIADVFDRPAATLATAARSANSLGRSGNSAPPSSAAAREIRTAGDEPERDFAFELSDTNLVHVFYSLHHAETPNTHTGLVYPLADLLLGAAEDVDTTECVESRTTSARRATPFALAQRFAAHLHDGKRTPTYVRARLIGTAIAFCDLEFVITNLRATRNVDHLGLHRGNDGNDENYCEKIHNRFAVPGKPSFTERRAFEALQRDESLVDKKNTSTSLCWIPAEFPDPKFKTLTAFLAPYDAGKDVLYCANCVREIVCKPGSGKVVRRKKTAAVAGGQSQGRRGGSNLNSAQQVGRTQSEEVGGVETPQNTKPKRLLRRHMTTDEERARLERFIVEEFGDSSAEGPAQSSQRPTARTSSVAASAEQQHQNSTVKVSFTFRAKLPCKNDLFCCGKCSTAYKMKRSGSKLRDVLFKHERGVCQTCLVDCEKVYLRLLQMARTESSRASSFSAGVAAGDEKIGCAAKIAGTTQLATASATSSTPQPTASGARKQYLEDVFRDTLALCIREKVKVSGYLRQILEAESVTAGMLWNCDHVREVRDGGGEAEDLSEIQTLCVFCHARKTMGHPSS